MANLKLATLPLLFALAFKASAADDAPRNVILFVGDGMGVSTVTAARILDGQNKGGQGEENLLSFEHFPNVALVKTYNVDAQVSDSAGTMTALIAGQRTRAGVISVGPQVERGDCATQQEHELTTLLEEAEQRGLKTGIVSTARITHATPAAAYAHAADRNWEAAVPPDAEGVCADIATQLVEFPHGDGVDVVLGGGRSVFLPTDVADVEEPFLKGYRQDQRNLVAEWIGGGKNRRYVHDLAGFETLPAQGQVLGLFEHSHMEFEADRASDRGGEPSLAQMTRFAIERLRGEGGFLLVAEGGRIDHAHHAGNAYRALMDAIAFAEAVEQAVAMTNPENTLILVTADHSHTLTIAGYPARGNPILGYVVEVDGETATDAEGQQYTTLGYANGPGARTAGEGAADEGLPPTHIDYRQRATHRMLAETHAGEDVAAYALGVAAEQVRGVMDQHELHGVMRAALFGADESAESPRTDVAP